MREKLCLDHVLIKVNFTRRADIRSLRKRYGHVTVGWLLEVYSMMSEDSKGYIDREAVELCASEYGLEEIASELISYCIQKEILSQDGDLITNSVVQADKIKLKNYRDRKKSNQQAYRGRSQGGNEMETPDTVTDTDINNKKEYVVDLPCIKLERNDWDAWVLNFHHGNEKQAREMCVAASDYRQSEGKGLPENCMAYLRQWYKRSLKFDQPKTVLERKPIQEALRPQPKLFTPQPKPQVSPEATAKFKQDIGNLLAKTTKAVSA